LIRPCREEDGECLGVFLLLILLGNCITVQALCLVHSELFSIFTSCISTTEDWPSKFLSTLIYMHITQEPSDRLLWSFVLQDFTKECLWI